MEPFYSVLVAGQQPFTSQLLPHLDELLPAAEVLCVNNDSALTHTLRQKGNYWTHLLVEITFFKYHFDDYIDYCKELCPAIRTVVFATTPVKCKADALITGRINKEKLEGLFCKREHEKAEQLITQAMKDGYKIRQLQVFNGIMKRQTAEEMAAYLYISKNTIKEHRQNLYAMTGMSGERELAFFGFRRGWVDEYCKSNLNDEVLKRMLEKKQ